MATHLQVLDCDLLSASFKKQFVMHVFSPKQELAVDVEGMKLKVIIEAVSTHE
jgi:hypothetical protein